MRRPSRLLRARGPQFAVGICVALVTQAGATESILIGMNDVDRSSGRQELVRIDRTTGVAARLHLFTGSSGGFESLAYDPRDNVLWTTNGGALVRVQPLTFQATIVGDTALDDLDGLAVHPLGGDLFGVTYARNDLLWIDKVDAGSVVVNGAVEAGDRLEDLAFDPAGRLYVLSSRALVEVDPRTGARLSRVFLMGATGLAGLVWDPARNTFLSAADRDGFKDIVAIDRATGLVTFLDPALHSGCKDIRALALVPRSPVVPVALEALGAEREADGAVHLAWLAAEPSDCSVERGLGPAGPWSPFARVAEPAAGHLGAWRYELHDREAAADPALRAVPLAYRVLVAGPNGDPGTLVLEVGAAPPERALLRPNAPNPFNPTTRFEFELGAPARVVLTLYDVRGALVQRLQTSAGPGRHALVWDGRDRAGMPLPAGIYPYVFSTGGQRLRGRAVLVE